MGLWFPSDFSLKGKSPTDLKNVLDSQSLLVPIKINGVGAVDEAAEIAHYAVLG